MITSSHALLRYGVYALCVTLVSPYSSVTYASDGSVIIKPRVHIYIEHDDNIYRENKTNGVSKPDSDFIAKIAPGVKIRKGDRKEYVEADASLEHKLYKRHHRNDRLDGRAHIKGRTQINDSLAWSSDARYSYTHANRGDNEAQPTAVSRSPMASAVLRVKTALEKSFDKLSLSPRVGYENVDTKDGRRFDGRLIDRSLQRRDAVDGGIRAGYKVSEVTEIFVDAARIAVRYDKKDAEYRNSNGGTYMLGFKHKTLSNVNITAAVGMTDRYYKSAALKDVRTLAANLDTRWNIQPGSQLRLRLTYGDSVRETSSKKTGGVIPASASLRFTQDITDDVKSWVQVRADRFDYVGGKGSDNGLRDRKDTLMRFGIGADYALSEQIKLVLSYEHINRTSNVRLAEYRDNAVQIGLRYEF